jgi:hypothetical protein
MQLELEMKKPTRILKLQSETFQLKIEQCYTVILKALEKWLLLFKPTLGYAWC